MHATEILTSEHSIIEQVLGRHERYLELANTLAKKFGVRRDTTTNRHFAGCCGHHN